VILHKVTKLNTSRRYIYILLT